MASPSGCAVAATLSQRGFATMNAMLGQKGAIPAARHTA
jgi:hypothetical protein